VRIVRDPARERHRLAEIQLLVEPFRHPVVHLDHDVHRHVDLARVRIRAPHQRAELVRVRVQPEKPVRLRILETLHRHQRLRRSTHASAKFDVDPVLHLRHYELPVLVRQSLDRRRDPVRAALHRHRDRVRLHPAPHDAERSPCEIRRDSQLLDRVDRRAIRRRARLQLRDRRRTRHHRRHRRRLRHRRLSQVQHPRLPRVPLDLVYIHERRRPQRIVRHRERDRRRVVVEHDAEAVLVGRDRARVQRSQRGRRQRRVDRALDVSRLRIVGDVRRRRRRRARRHLELVGARGRSHPRPADPGRETVQVARVDRRFPVDLLDQLQVELQARSLRDRRRCEHAPLEARRQLLRLRVGIQARFHARAAVSTPARGRAGGR